MEKWSFYGILYVADLTLLAICGESEDIMLAIKDTFKDISKEKKVTQFKMANALGISKQNFSNKVQRNTFSPDELAKIADMLEMELAFIDKSAKIEGGNKYVIFQSDEE